ncbi:hypothetical protein [Anaerovorax sp. IOR16]|uniref:hypothetical protein n=1 Tax=Anaerovorax sp. IOR16 TaxID=2773458 RepID=UPI0019D307F2|nr:hypothetical protein [Anaerovorax sp. IOR16]
MDSAYLFDAPDNRIKYIADYYGCEKQSNKAIEELNELAVAIAHYQKYWGSEKRENLIEEIADVEIMIEQIKYLHGINQSDIDAVKEYKIQRTIDKIGGAK